MGSRFPSHQLSNGLYVSGRPEQQKEKPPTMSSIAMPYTGGDIKKSGELGKMFELHTEKSRKSGPLITSSSSFRNGSFGGTASQSGPAMPNALGRSNYSGSISSTVPGSGSGSSLSRQKANSGPIKHVDSVKRTSGPQSGVVNSMARQNSGPLTAILPTTGLITSGPLNSSCAPHKVSGQLAETVGSMKAHSTATARNQAITFLSQDDDDDYYLFRGSLPKSVLWSVLLLFAMGFIAGGFILAAVHNAVLLIAVVVIFGVVAALFIWNTLYGRRAIIGFISQYSNTELKTARDGQYVKVTGVVTCGNLPLESSYCKVPRCVYTSTSLYEYRNMDTKGANPKHRRFTWGLRSVERHAVDFYISDFQSGLRALVKAGYGAQVTAYVDESVVVDINKDSRESSPEFLHWLRRRNLPSDDRMMRLTEGYVKEGSTVSVMGVVRRNDNVLMIVPPTEPLSTGCQWSKCILPANLQGIVLRCEDDTSKIDVVPV